MFDVTSYVWHFMDTKCGKIIADSYFFYHIFLYAGIILIDIIAFYQLFMIKKVSFLFFFRGSEK